MSGHDALLYLVAFIATYCFFLSFRAPFSLAIDTRGLAAWKARLCRWVWPLVVTSGAFASTAVFAAKHDAWGCAAGFLGLAFVIFCALIVPGIEAFKQNHGWGENRRR